MPLNMSTALRTRILGRESFNDIMGGGCMRIFTGTQPSNADQPEQGTLLGVATLNGAPWNAGFPANGIQWTQLGTWMQPTGEIVVLGSYAGNATWFRIVGNAPDNGGLTLSAPRIDGSIGVPGAGTQMIWDDTGIEPHELYPLNAVIFAFPPLI